VVPLLDWLEEPTLDGATPSGKAVEPVERGSSEDIENSAIERMRGLVPNPTGDGIRQLLGGEPAGKVRMEDAQAALIALIEGTEPGKVSAPPLTADELQAQTIEGTRDWNAYPPTLEEVKAWRQSMKKLAERGRMVSWTGAGGIHILRMAKAEKRFKAIGLL